LEVYLFLLNNL